MNVAIKAIVERASDHEVEVVGLRRGWMSLLASQPLPPRLRCELRMQTGWRSGSGGPSEPAAGA